MLDEIHKEAKKYIGGISSKQEAEAWIIREVTHHKNVFAEAIVLVHVNGELSIGQLSDLLDYKFSPELIDIVSDFFLRDILKKTNKGKDDNYILSGRQISRRKNKENLTFFDNLSYKE